MQYITRIENFIRKYKVVSREAIFNYFFEISTKSIHNKLETLINKRKIYCVKKESVVYYCGSSYTDFIKDNNINAHNSSLLLMARLRYLYKDRIIYDVPSYYPKSIKFCMKSDSGDKFFEIVYMPYSENNVMAKQIGFLLNTENDEIYNVKRFVICENKWMINNWREEINKYIPNITSFVLINKQNAKNIFFYEADEETENEREQEESNH